MPQLSPMSWVLVFGVLLVCVVLLMVSIWWGVVGEYKVMHKGKVDKSVFDGSTVVKWGFGKKFSLGGQK